MGPGPGPSPPGVGFGWKQGQFRGLSRTSGTSSPAKGTLAGAPQEKARDLVDPPGGPTPQPLCQTRLWTRPERPVMVNCRAPNRGTGFPRARERHGRGL